MKRFAWLFAAMLLLVPGSCNKLDPEGGNNPYTPISLTTKQTGYVQAGTAFVKLTVNYQLNYSLKIK